MTQPNSDWKTSIERRVNETERRLDLHDNSILNFTAFRGYMLGAATVVGIVVGWFLEIFRTSHLK